MEGCTTQVSVDRVLGILIKAIAPRMWQLNGLLLLNAILMGVVVGVGAYAPRYRRHPVIGVLFLGAATLFLPIISNVASTVGSVRLIITYLLHQLVPEVTCTQGAHLILVLVWTGLVVVIGINASVVVAGDAREGRNIDPPTILWIKAIWTAYLTFSTVPLNSIMIRIIAPLFVIMFTKLLFKYSTFYKARQSFALGRSPRLIAGYMAHLQQPCHQVVDGDATPPPALVVMGEDEVQLEKQPHGYTFKRMPNQGSNRLVTLDRVWQLNNDMNMLQKPTVQPKDLCFSFALFKLLRCRFAKYSVVEAGFMKADKFFRATLLKGTTDHKRVFGVIEDELSFIHDYYYSSLPIYYSHHVLPILSIALSLCSIGYCLFLIVFFSQLLADPRASQLTCYVDKWCDQSNSDLLEFGTLFFDLVPTYLVLAVLVLAETRDIASCICSNWTKVALICHHVNQARWQLPAVVQKCIGLLLEYRRCKLVNNWNGNMKQCSILAVHCPGKKTPFLLRHVLRRRDRKRKKKVHVHSAVKAAIFEALKREEGLAGEEGALKHIRPPSTGVRCDGKCPAYSILVWHVATSVFEVSQTTPQSMDDPQDSKVAATHLSRYCAYLVTICPELLPDDDEWCKSLYEDVKKDADRVLPAALHAAEYQQLVLLLSADSNHQVLKDGAELGKQLVDSKTGWEALARFWSQMILYLAPSDNLEGHADAIARGGELITLLWALLAHAGIAGTAAATSAAANHV
ncbi:unnamed protein product [Urochloa decumbens]|uniref:DUF4220 domain-containing protein n=1 Tax=Urochloa decumbens TaxID=240449 RepID=A0ABC9CEX1_9POAL